MVSSGSYVTLEMQKNFMLGYIERHIEVGVTRDVALKYGLIAHPNKVPTDAQKQWEQIWNDHWVALTDALNLFAQSDVNAQRTIDQWRSFWEQLVLFAQLENDNPLKETSSFNNKIITFFNKAEDFIRSKLKFFSAARAAGRCNVTDTQPDCSNTSETKTTGCSTVTDTKPARSNVTESKPQMKDNKSFIKQNFLSTPSKTSASGSSSSTISSPVTVPAFKKTKVPAAASSFAARNLFETPEFKKPADVTPRKKAEKNPFGIGQTTFKPDYKPQSGSSKASFEIPAATLPNMPVHPGNEDVILVGKEQNSILKDICKNIKEGYQNQSNMIANVVSSKTQEIIEDLMNNFKNFAEQLTESNNAQFKEYSEAMIDKVLRERDSQKQQAENEKSENKLQEEIDQLYENLENKDDETAEDCTEKSDE